MIYDNVSIFSDPFETARKFAEYFLEKVKKSIRCNVALSGGSTPKRLFDYLTANYSKSKIWQKIHFYWGDERCVAPDNEQSNYRMTSEYLLDHINIPTGNIHRIFGEYNAQEEATRYSDLLKNNLAVKNDFPVFDLIILGMGDDGHAASIFPNNMDLLNSKYVCAVAEHPETEQQRITLTGRTINNAREVIFLVTGDNKKEKVFEILNQAGEWEKYPASYINPVEGRLSWFLDKTAASKLL